MPQVRAFAVLGESGKRLGTHVVETNGCALVEQLKTIPGKRHVCPEEGTQSAWMYEILSPHAEEVIVGAVPESRGQKSDEKDAYQLAEQLRTGALEKRVFKEVGEFGTLRELGRTHGMIVQDVVRVQNRIKALLRSRGVSVSGKTVYSEKGREEFFAKLPDASRGAAKTLYAQYDAVEVGRRQAEKDLVAEASEYQTKPWSEEAPIEAWFPLSAREHKCFDLVEDASASSSITEERRSHTLASGFAGKDGREDDRLAREGLGRSPQNAGKPPCSRQPNAGKPRRMRRLEAYASVEENGVRCGEICLDTTFHRSESLPETLGALARAEGARPAVGILWASFGPVWWRSTSSMAAICMMALPYGIPF